MSQMREILLRSFEAVMHYRVEVTASFKNSVRSAVSYIADVLYMPNAAGNLSGAVADSLERLETNATFFPVDTRASALLGRTIYRLDIKRSYRLYFVVDKDSATVTVFSFLHKRQNAAGHIIEDFSAEQ